MKKAIFLMAVLATMVSCSSDDGGEGKSQTSLEMLIENGNWNFQSAEVLEIYVNSEPPRSKEEIENIIMDDMPGTVFKFFEDGAGSLTLPTGESQAFPYTIQYSGNNIQTILIGEDELNNVEVSENSLKFTWHIDWQVNPEDTGSQDWVSVAARLEFKH